MVKKFLSNSIKKYDKRYHLHDTWDHNPNSLKVFSNHIAIILHKHVILQLLLLPSRMAYTLDIDYASVDGHQMRYSFSTSNIPYKDLCPNFSSQLLPRVLALRFDFFLSCYSKLQDQEISTSSYIWKLIGRINQVLLPDCVNVW